VAPEQSVNREFAFCGMRSPSVLCGDVLEFALGFADAGCCQVVRSVSREWRRASEAPGVWLSLGDVSWLPLGAEDDARAARDRWSGEAQRQVDEFLETLRRSPRLLALSLLGPVLSAAVVPEETAAGQWEGDSTPSARFVEIPAGCDNFVGSTRLWKRRRPAVAPQSSLDPVVRLGRRCFSLLGESGSRRLRSLVCPSMVFLTCAVPRAGAFCSLRRLHLDAHIRTYWYGGLSVFWEDVAPGLRELPMLRDLELHSLLRGRRFRGGPGTSVKASLHLLLDEDPESRRRVEQAAWCGPGRLERLVVHGSRSVDMSIVLHLLQRNRGTLRAFGLHLASHTERFSDGSRPRTRVAGEAAALRPWVRALPRDLDSLSLRHSGLSLDELEWLVQRYDDGARRLMELPCHPGLARFLARRQNEEGYTQVVGAALVVVWPRVPHARGGSCPECRDALRRELDERDDPYLTPPSGTDSEEHDRQDHVGTEAVRSSRVSRRVHRRVRARARDDARRPSRRSRAVAARHKKVS